MVNFPPALPLSECVINTSLRRRVRREDTRQTNTESLEHMTARANYGVRYKTNTLSSSVLLKGKSQIFTYLRDDNTVPITVNQKYL